ncbi:MAG: alpha/beta hydrolase [Mariniphaga sp.]|nr:alpha/beta hydrolase [Mariniphaga sp.]
MNRLIVLFFLFFHLSSFAQDERKVLVESLLEGIRTEKDIRYNTGDRPLLLDVYYPESFKEGEILPCVVWIHGGALVDASLDKNYDLIRWGVARTVHSGYISVSIDYRLITESPLPTAIQDCATAIRFLKSHAGQYGIDTMRIAVVGESAGGYLAGMFSYTCNTNIFTTNEWKGVSNQVACGVLWYPALNYEPYNMIDYISPDDIPVISVHGDKDSTVPINRSFQLQRKSAEKGLSFQLHIIEGAQHGFFDDTWKFNEANRKYMEQAIQATVDYINRQLYK